MMGAQTPNIRKENVETDEFMMYKWNLQDQMLRQKNPLTSEMNEDLRFD